MAKRFFYVSMGILALMIAYHFGATGVAKASSAIIVGAGGAGFDFIVTDTGDIYCPPGQTTSFPWILRGNVWGGPTATENATWGSIKQEFK